MSQSEPPPRPDHGKGKLKIMAMPRDPQAPPNVVSGELFRSSSSMDLARIFGEAPPRQPAA